MLSKQLCRLELRLPIASFLAVVTIVVDLFCAIVDSVDAQGAIA